MKTLKTKLWKMFLRIARSITLTVDDWIQVQEVKLRQDAVRQEALAEVNPVQSAVREKAVRRERKVKTVRRPRLVYQHGEFVRS